LLLKNVEKKKKMILLKPFIVIPESDGLKEIKIEDCWDSSREFNDPFSKI